jgi:hypothetical protein
MGGGSASSPDGGTSPIKRRSGCAIAGVAEGETGAGVSFLCLVFLALLVKRRALLRN